jgi:RimJ/RimL family protein N-acetyltransferase
VLATQTANTASMRLAAKLGFVEAERFHLWDADQWLGLRPPNGQGQQPPVGRT